MRSATSRLLKVDAKTPLPAASWGDSTKAKVGDWVLAIGNPFGLGGTVTAGIISATARDIHSSPYDDFLQTDASINRGNSGGPMFNLAGEVIGINTAIFSPSGGSIGIGFAIPAASARPIIDQLKATGKVERGWIGAHIQPVTDEIAEAVGLDKGRGAMIAAIDPAEPGGAGQTAAGRRDPEFMTASRSSAAGSCHSWSPDTPPDKSVKLSIWRDGKEQEVALKVAELEPEPAGAGGARAAKAETATQRRCARSQAREADARPAQAVLVARDGEGRRHHGCSGKQHGSGAGAAAGRPRRRHRSRAGRQSRRGASKEPPPPKRSGARTCSSASSATAPPASSPSPWKAAEGYSAAASAGDGGVARKRMRRAGFFRFGAGEVGLLDVAEAADFERQGREFDRGRVIGRRQLGDELGRSAFRILRSADVRCGVPHCGRTGRSGCRAGGAAWPAPERPSASTGRTRACANARFRGRDRRESAAPGESAARTAPRTGRRRASGNRFRYKAGRLRIRPCTPSA